MNKNLIVLIIVVLAQLKKDNKVFLIEKEIANLKKGDFIKNAKSHKKTFSTKLLGAFFVINEGNKKSKINQKFNFKLIFKISYYRTIIKNAERFDFNGINFLFFGCC